MIANLVTHACAPSLQSCDGSKIGQTSGPKKCLETYITLDTDTDIHRLSSPSRETFASKHAENIRPRDGDCRDLAVGRSNGPYMVSILLGIHVLECPEP